jgi:hypothetical protein
MPEQNTKPVNKYLPPRPRPRHEIEDVDLVSMATKTTPKGFWKWLDQALDQLPG